ncbi:MULTISPECIES: LysE family translocator [Streptomyces]|uniref:LysE family translocator n=1 Tax=Streptomyces griseus TaxID=1911 RepID=UPI0029CA5BEC|nr:LysE family translocator [Streptomyces sp. ID01-9D]
MSRPPDAAFAQSVQIVRIGPAPMAASCAGMALPPLQGPDPVRRLPVRLSRAMYTLNGPISVAELLGFIAASLVIIVVPGPDLTLLLANTARSGRRAGRATAAGIMLGHAVLASAAVAGLTALLAASQVGYTLLRVAGTLYLVYLGAQSLADFVRLRRRAAADTPASRSAEPAPEAAGRMVRTAFRQGLISNLLNPKVAVFYLALLPQFILPGLGTTASHSVLAGVFWLMCLMWFALVLLLLARVEVLLRRRSVRRGLAGASGVGLVGLGAALALRG